MSESREDAQHALLAAAEDFVAERYARCVKPPRWWRRVVWAFKESPAERVLVDATARCVQAELEVWHRDMLL